MLMISFLVHMKYLPHFYTWLCFEAWIFRILLSKTIVRYV
jgi:hypothetical protein